jgi:hypothetical protein
MDYLSLTACIKNEAKYIQEWLAYYKSVGVEKFYIYNNRSKDDTEDKIDELSFRNDITLIDYNPTNPDKIGLAYQRSNLEYGKKTHWMLFCDADEFFMPSATDDLKVLLQDYEQFSGLGVPWQIYGSSGHLLSPEGLCLENYLNRAETNWPTNKLVKSIIKMCEIEPHALSSTGYLTSHLWNTKKGVVDENYNIIDSENQGRVNEISIKKIRVNHYFTKSYEDWLEKRHRGRGGLTKSQIPIEMFDAYDQNKVFDDIALNFVGKIKHLL